jgi:hypothetical protein
VLELVYPAMGLLTLGILWLNTILIAVAALKQRSQLGARLSQLLAARAAGRLVEGEVTRGDGPSGALATRTIHQVGRAMTVSGPDRILLTQAKVELDRHGGEIAVGAERRAIPAAGRWELWLPREAASERSLTDFEAAFAKASTQKGLTTTATQSVRVGQKVHWLEGELLATTDPIAELRARRAGLAVFALGSIVVCGAITAVALVPPIFGTISTIGGALGLLFFVLVQPAGVRARNWARLPSEHLLVATWQRA